MSKKNQDKEDLKRNEEVSISNLKEINKFFNFLDKTLPLKYYEDEQAAQEDIDIIRKIGTQKDSIKTRNYMMLGIILSCITMLVLALAYTFNKESNINPVFSVNTNTKEVNRTIVLPFPIQSLDTLSDWMMSVVERSYSFDFSNYDQRVQSVRPYFTSDGYDSYIKALEMSKVGDAVKSNNLEISTIVSSKPTWITGGITLGGTTYWKYSMEVITSYYAGNKVENKHNKVELLVYRVPTSENPKGLAINQFFMSSLD